jgi:cytochrome c553
MVFGKYLALTSCTECHGQELIGSTETSTPDLAIAASYSDQAFERLMRTGIALGDRELRSKSKVARKRFAHFTGNEIRALHRYLQTLAPQNAMEGG